MIFCLITPIIVCPKVKGNLFVLVGNFLYIVIPLLISMFLITFALEYIIIYLFIKNLINKRLNLSKSIFAVNFFTFPATQILAIALLSQYIFNLWNYFLIELIPIVLESLYFLWLPVFSYPPNRIFLPIERYSLFVTI